MQVSKLKSLSAKLFYLMTGLIMLTVLGNSWQNGRFFNQYLEANLQDGLIQKSKEVSQNLSSTLDNWSNQVRLGIGALSAGDGGRAMQNLLRTNAELAGIGVFRTSNNSARELFFGLTPDTKSPRFEDQDPSRVGFLFEKAARQIADSLTKQPATRSLLIAISDQLALPVIIVAIPTRTDSEIVWAVCLFWQNRLSASLPKTRSTRAHVIDSDGLVLIAPTSKNAIARKNLRSLALIKDALKSTTLSGFKGRYPDAKGKLWLGSYMRLSDYGVTAIVEQDAKIATAATSRILKRTGLWGAFFVLVAMMISFLASASLTKNLRAVTDATMRIASGDFSPTLKNKSKDEVGLLSSAVVHMAKQIQDLLLSQVDKARVEKELETARMVQSTFFPKEMVRSRNLSIVGTYQPAAECGGDWWGHFKGKDGVEYVFIADAMGHGVPAALVTAMSYSSCMTIADIVANGNHGDSPATIISRFNRVLFDAVRGSISMTFFAAVLDMKKGVMKYANAGHNFPVIIPMNQDDPRATSSPYLSRVTSVPLISLQLKGSPLGVDRSAEYKEKEINLVAGDKVFFFTDGLIECESPNKKPWGRKALLEQLGNLSGKDPEAIKTGILDSAFAFFNKNPIKDDITVVVLEVNKSWVPGEAAALPDVPGEKTVIRISDLGEPSDNDQKEAS